MSDQFNDLSLSLTTAAYVTSFESFPAFQCIAGGDTLQDVAKYIIMWNHHGLDHEIKYFLEKYDMDYTLGGPVVPDEKHRKAVLFLAVVIASRWYSRSIRMFWPSLINASTESIGVDDRWPSITIIWSLGIAREVAAWNTSDITSTCAMMRADFAIRSW